MASADFLVYRNTKSSPRSPPVRALSFYLWLVHLQLWDYWLRALQRCACLPSQNCLLCTFCSSVQVFVVLLPLV